MGEAAPGSRPEEVRFDDPLRWHELAHEAFLPLDCQALGTGRFHYSALMARFSDSLAAEMAVSASRVVRRRSEADRSSAAYFKLVWQLTGQGRITQGGNESTLQPGTWTIYDTTREYTLESTDRSRFLVLLVPQLESMGWTSAAAALGGRALPGGGAAHIVLSALAGMLRDGTPLDDDSQRTLQDSVVALLERALYGQWQQHGATLPMNNARRLERVRAYVLDRLGEPTLTPDSVAQAFGMSRRSLYNLFLAGQDTPRAFIQRARLAQAARLLAEPAAGARPVCDVARACGFIDFAHFSRSFRARYGVAPSRWREHPPLR